MTWLVTVSVIIFAYSLFFLSLTGFLSLQQKKLSRATEKLLQGRSCSSCGAPITPWDGTKHPFYEPIEYKHSREMISHFVHVTCSSCEQEEILAVWTDHSLRTTKIPPERLLDPTLPPELRGDLSILEYEEPAGQLSTTD